MRRHRFRMTALPEPVRLPSARPRSRDRSGPKARSLLHSHGFDPAPFRLPRAGPRPVKGVVVASTYSAAAPAGEPCGLPSNEEVEKMRLPDFCNRLTTRAPCGSIDSRARPRRALRPGGGRRPPAAGATTNDPSGASLDGDPPASAGIGCHLDPRPGPEPWKTTSHEAPLGPGGAVIDSTSGGAPRAAALSSASRVSDVASDVLCRASPVIVRGFTPEWPPGGAPDPPPPRSRQRPRLPRARTPSIDECSLRLLARGIKRSPPPFSRLRRREPASDARSSLREGETRPAAVGRKARRRSSTSAIETIHEHDRCLDRPNPGCTHLRMPRSRQPPWEAGAARATLVQR